jgi:glycosyltransferase involved in cell wall biosynthesis
MLGNPDTTVVVPAYCESTVIAGVVGGLRASFDHVVVVDDGSTDDTAEHAASAGATVLRHGVNCGQGAALQTGITAALRRPGCQYVVTFDADGQHQVEDAVRLVERLRDGDLDVAFGSRSLDDRTRPPLLKRAVLRAAVVYTNAVTGMRLTDAHNGLRALTREAAAGLAIQHDGMAHATEIVRHVGRSGLRYAEVPVHILYTDYSRAKGQSLWNSVNILFDLLVR